MGKNNMCTVAVFSLTEKNTLSVHNSVHNVFPKLETGSRSSLGYGQWLREVEDH